MKIPTSPFATHLSGSAKETELRLRNIFQWEKKRPPVVFLILAALAALLCGGLVSCQPSGEAPSDSGNIALDTLADTQNPAPALAAEPDLESDFETDTYSEDQLNLDGVGSNDDSLTLIVTRQPSGYEGRVDLYVRLGTGQELHREILTDGRYFCEAIHTAYLTSRERQTMILELVPWGANWTPGMDILLEVEGNNLVECGSMDYEGTGTLMSQVTLWGLEVIDREDSPLQALRVPTSAGKWHGPEWGTLTWEDGQWNYVSDGYFTDTWTITVDGGVELTLALRGRTMENYPYQNYDQIQVFQGEVLFQTITENSFTPDGHCWFEHFNADYPLHAIDIRDINFDGAADFGVPCNSTHNDGHCWFLWDAEARQFRYAFSLGGTPTIEPETKQIIEEWWDDSVYITYNTYEYNDQGKLTLVSSRKGDK